MTQAEPLPAQLPVVVGFDDVNLAFGETPALVHLSFSMRAGETRVVLGAAGSGKTMLLKPAVGLVKPDSGHISLFGEEVTGRKESQLYGLRSKVGILFQEGGLFDSLTIAENVAYPLLNQLAVHKDGHALPPEEVDQRVRESLSFVELEHTLDKFPSELSGGMRRRAGIARAIVTAPQLVLYDSPTAGLDPITANEIDLLILDQKKKRGITSVVVTHDIHGVRTFADRVALLNAGEIVASGTMADLDQDRNPFVVDFLKGSN